MSRSDGVFNEFCDGAWEKKEKKTKSFIMILI